MMPVALVLAIVNLLFTNRIKYKDTINYRYAYGPICTISYMYIGTRVAKKVTKLSRFFCNVRKIVSVVNYKLRSTDTSHPQSSALSLTQAFLNHEETWKGVLF